VPASLHLVFADALPTAAGDDEEVIVVETDDAPLPPASIPAVFCGTWHNGAPAQLKTRWFPWPPTD